MRRFLLAALVALCLLSLAANGLLGWLLVRSQKEYLALSRQFVRVKQSLTEAQQRSAAGGAGAAAGAPSTTAPAVVSAKTDAVSTTASGEPGAAADEGVAAIRARYTPQLEAVQAECEGQLNTLLAGAKAEYNQAKAAGGDLDVAALGAKYYAQADGLRRACDRKVEAVLSRMTGDLNAAGLPTDLVPEVRQVYADRIVERQAEIMAKTPAR